MGVLILILLIINPIIWCLLQCQIWVRVLVAAATWGLLYWYIGESCKLVAGQAYHGLFIWISVGFLAFAVVMNKIYAAGYNNRRYYGDDNLITDAKNYWHPMNIWHDNDK